MKLLRYGEKGKEKPGMLDASGQIRDLSSVVADITPDTLAPDALKKLTALDPLKLPLVSGSPRLGACVAGTPKLIGVGLNYRDHAEETGQKIPAEPILFMKAISAICGPNDDIIIPKGAEKADWEVELGVIIGTKAQYVSVESAPHHIIGYCVGNDLSERAFQFERGGNWSKGKSADTFAPLGPYLVTKDEVPDPQTLTLFLELNGEKRQNGTTANMIFSVFQIVSYISQFMTLTPGDVILTGTPAGVGFGAKPQRFLTSGDTMHLGVSGLGTQRQRVIAKA